MKTKTRPNNIGIVSLGCAKNLIDSELLLKQLDESKLRIAFDPATVKGLDTVVINTCGFIRDAKQESIDTILQYAQAKAEGKLRHVFVMGCLSERYREQLKKDIPEVDAFYGVNELRKIVKDLGGHYNSHLLGERMISTPSHYAYLKIAEGCDRKCSFCAIPGIRGGHVSRPSADIVKEAESLVNNGVKEIIVISQDTTYYGLDLYGRRRIASLLNQLSEINQNGWIRLHYAYPHGFPTDILPVMRDHNNICKYLDMPLQHINDRILKSMKRGLSSAKTMKLIESIRKEIPGITLRSSFIVGYPGETDKEFNELLDFVNEAEFDRLGVFTYSQEEDTTAFKLGDAISRKIKQERADELMVLQEAISLKKNNAIVGKKLKVLIDRKEGDYYTARSEGDSPEIDNEVLIPVSGNKLRLGTFSEVVIKSAESFDLYADLPGKHHHGRK
ncbi:MAG: 30S ribosomal protein S12 methylthiotransferase RimO [Bacteroidetes bacterium]|nr:30S ribosomal protein S12 methylthiotransferase RimO [Bacteroidota bacterium]